MEKLISRLVEKTHELGKKVKTSKLGKAALIAALATTIGVNTAAATGCELLQQGPAHQSNNEHVVDKNNPSDPTDPTNPTDPTTQIVEVKPSESLLKNVNLENLSDVMQYLLTDEYYLDLLDTFAEKSLSETLHANILKPIPYKVLKEHGYTSEDIYNIMNDNYYADSYVYIENGKLYVAVNAEKKNDEKLYCGSFLLEFELTDQELYELEMLHADNEHKSGTWILAPLYIDALGKKKSCKVVSEAYITKDALEESLESGRRVNNFSPVFVIYTGREKYEDYDLDDTAYYSMIMFMDGNTANAVTNAKYLELSSYMSSFFAPIEYYGSNAVLTSEIDWESLIKDYRYVGFLDSMFRKIKYFDSVGKFKHTNILGESIGDYIGTFNYGSQISKN